MRLYQSKGGNIVCAYVHVVEAEDCCILDSLIFIHNYTEVSVNVKFNFIFLDLRFYITLFILLDVLARNFYRLLLVHSLQKLLEFRLS